LLLEQRGCRCHEAADSASVLSTLAVEPIDLLVCDIHMPENEQLELVRTLAKDHPSLPVILLTGQPQVSTAAAAVSLSVVAYLTKPLKFSELWNAIEQAQSRSRERREHGVLKAAVRESIAVLEQTKQHFKSRQLADLRRRLEQAASDD
jgi:DNA-binding NtrC family response regulator